MPKFKSILEMTIKAATQADANNVAGNAAVHLRESFNDDDSISPGVRFLSGGPQNVVIPTELLSALIDAADCAADEQEHAAERNRQEGEREGAKACARRARQHRSTFRQARTFFNGAVPKRAAKPRGPDAYVLIWGGGDEPESPAISLHATKQLALAQARKNLEMCIDDQSSITRVIKELKAGETAMNAPNDSWMEIHSHDIECA